MSPVSGLIDAVLVPNGLNSSVLRWSLIVFRYAAAAYQLSELIQLNAVRYILRVTGVARALASGR